MSANDWSAKILDDDLIDDLPVEAIQEAKIQYLKKNPHLADEMKLWDDATVLNKGKITRTAILLSGKPE